METTVQDFEIRTGLVTVLDVGRFLQQLRKLAKGHAVTIICYNADNMAGRRHAEAALSHAIRSFQSGSPVAKTLEMEALLYAAGTRQCADAATLGIHEGVNRVYICCCPVCPGIFKELQPLIRFVDDTYDHFGADRVLRLKHRYSISDAEIYAAGGVGRIPDLVIERVTLLDAYR